MPLFDYFCKKCKITEERYGTDRLAASGACPKCGKEMAWRPYVRTQSTKSGIDCTYSGKTFGSYGELETWAKTHNKTVVPTREYEANHINRGQTPEARIAKQDTKRLREELKKNVYRQRHGIDVRE